MAVTIRNCVGVDIGTCTIRVAAMEMGKAGPRITALMEEPLRLEPNLTEPQRHQAIAKQLGEMLKRGGVRTKNAVFCMPGQSVFVRRIKLPKTTPERMARLVRFAAREQIPFPLDMTVLEYQVFESASAPEADVLLVAVKRDYIQSFMKLVRRTGLRPIGVAVSSLALYNFHELNESKRDLTPKAGGVLGALLGQVNRTKTAPAKKKEKKRAAKGKGKNAAAATAEATPESEPAPESPEPIEALGFEEIKAYVNLGASLMDLAIPKPGPERMIGFTRSVPLAGAEMDRAIRDRLGLDSLDKAREIKEREAVVLSTEFEVTGDADEINVEASEAVTAVADRLIGELRRSLDFYISQPEGVAVDRIVLSGGLSRLRYLSSYIEEKMSLPVEIAQVRHEQLRMPESFEGPLGPFAIAVGLGLQGLGLAQNRIDFLPEEMKSIRGLRERRNELIGMSAMLALMIAMSVNVGNRYVEVNRTAIQRLEEVIARHQEESVRIQKAIERHDKVATAYKNISRTATWRDFWLEFLRVFHEKRPPEVMIDEIVMRVDGIVVVKGVSPTRNAVNQFVQELEKLDGSNNTPKVGQVKIMEMDVQPRTDRRFPTQVFSFRLHLTTYQRNTRIRALGEEPAPAPTPAPAAAR